MSSILTVIAHIVSSMLISERVKEARKASKLSQAQLAKQCNVTRSTISQIESGLIKSPSARLSIKLSQQMSVSLEWLINGKGNMKDPVSELEKDIAFDQAEGKSGLAPLRSKYPPTSVVQKRIEDRMKRNNLTPDDMEMLTRGAVSAITVGGWLNGDDEPTDAELRIVAPHLGMPPDYFRTGIAKNSATKEAIDIEELRRAHPMPWPQAPDQINIDFLMDVSRRVSEDTGIDADKLSRIIAMAVIDHYTDAESGSDSGNGKP